MKILITTLLLIPFLLFSAGPDISSEKVADEVTGQSPQVKVKKSTVKIPVVEEIKTEVEVIRDQKETEVKKEVPAAAVKTNMTEKQGSRRSLSIYLFLLTGILLAVLVVASMIPPKTVKTD